MSARENPEAILAFWFGKATVSVEAYGSRSALWFGRDDAFDAEIRARFGDLLEHAQSGALNHWARAARSALALVLCLDQFPRNLYRNAAREFAHDAKALELARTAIECGFDAELHVAEASFLYMPFEHSESLADQDQCMALFESLVLRAPDAYRSIVEDSLGFARRHHEIIVRFGRFPHRNALLDRESTRDEQAYLSSGGETFGS